MVRSSSTDLLEEDSSDSRRDSGERRGLIPNPFMRRKSD
jgi:hypothetical protein